MRQISKTLAEHLAGEATTVCQVWRVTRRDGKRFGFTDHDQDLLVDDILCLAASGFAALEEESGEGLAAASGEVAGGFSSQAITEQDLAEGRFDGARVELFLVNWEKPWQKALLAVREIGEVVRAGQRFSAELRSMAHRLDQPQGRIYSRRCDAEFGDRRCGVRLEGFSATASMVGFRDRSHLLLSGIAGFAGGTFDHGMLTIGDTRHAVDSHLLQADGTAQVSLWLPLDSIPETGTPVTIVAGCDKRFSTCRDRFRNGLNFRGFPHVPGTDFSYSYSDGQRLHDGRPIVP